MEFIFLPRLLLAVVLGGLIGYERERGSRPAGLRTHILVCVSSALVMLTGEFIFNASAPEYKPDLTRLGAQVVSGIGFLGAGAIIREGVSVRGLTTAACLWSAACIGLAVGAGYYYGAVAATAVICGALVALRSFEWRFAFKSANMQLYVEAAAGEGVIASIEGVFNSHRAEVRKAQTLESDGELLAKYMLRLPDMVSKKRIIRKLSELDGVSRVYEDGRRSD